jgi:TonB family protein
MTVLTALRFCARKVLFLIAASVLASAQTTPSEDAKLPLLNETVARKMVKYKVDPEYPATARQFRIFGDVQAEIVIGSDGKVESILNATGNQLLQGPVKAALRKWVFEPSTVDGKGVRIRTRITFTFKL